MRRGGTSVLGLRTVSSSCARAEPTARTRAPRIHDCMTFSLTEGDPFPGLFRAARSVVYFVLSLSRQQTIQPFVLHPGLIPLSLLLAARLRDAVFSRSTFSV